MQRFLIVPLTAAFVLMYACLPVEAQRALKSGVSVAQPAAPTTNTTSDETVLRNAGLATNAEGLLHFFKLRGQGASAEQVAALIAKLEDKSAEVRNQAVGELIAIGPSAITALRQAVKDPDAAETSTLARRCLHTLEMESAMITSSALRELAKLKPAGAAEVLLAFLPDAEDATVLDEAKAALNAVALTKEGRPEPAILKALEDGSSLRRAVAVEVVCQNGQAEPRSILRKLLSDPSATVRLRAGLALANAREAKAVSTLITLLAELPVSQARNVEEFLISLAEDQAPAARLADDEASRVKCRDEWARWWLATEGARLIDELKKRTLTEVDRDRIVKLVEKLGDDSFDVRIKATKELKELGSVVIPLLQQASTHPDLEVRSRAQDCLAAIEKDKSAPLSPMVPKLIALRKPPGSVEALLNYIPSSTDDAIMAEVQNALNAVGIIDGKPDPLLVKSLDDKSPARRAAAAEAVTQTSLDENMAAVRKLLKDGDASVRLKVALALVCARQRDAMPTLIAALADAPVEQATAAEEYLYRVAGDTAPNNMPSGDDARAKRRDVWAKWWDEQGTKVALLDRSAVYQAARYLGYTLLVQAQNNMISELDASGKERWKLTGLNSPQDAQVLPGDRVLVAEYSGMRVTERNLKGDILWEKKISNYPQQAQRLQNGNTFIVTRNQLIEVDRGGRELFNINRPFSDVMSAHKMRDGHIVMVSNQGSVHWLDSTGKELKNFRTQGVSNYGNEVLANGNVLIPVSWQNKVCEYDKDGKLVWEKTVNQPMSAWRMPNGNTLVATQSWPTKLVELDREGKQIAEINTTNYTMRAKRR
jgi:HEAT repeat protein